MAWVKVAEASLGQSTSYTKFAEKTLHIAFGTTSSPIYSGPNQPYRVGYEPPSYLPYVALGVAVGAGIGMAVRGGRHD